MNRKTLRAREWFAVYFMLSLFMFLSLKALGGDYSRWPRLGGQPVPRPKVLVVINVKGEVKNPGKYHFPEGTSIRDVIAEAEPTQNADLTKIDLTKLVKKGQSITIPKKKAAKGKK